MEYFHYNTNVKENSYYLRVMLLWFGLFVGLYLCLFVGLQTTGMIFMKLGKL